MDSSNSPPGASERVLLRPNSTTDAYEGNLRLVKKLICGNRYPTLGKLLKEEMDQELAKGNGGLADQSEADESLQPDSGAHITHISHRQPPRPSSAVDSRYRSRTPLKGISRPHSRASAIQTDNSKSAVFRPIQPEEAVREKVAAVREEQDLAPSEVEFLEQVLLDALSMPRNRRSDGTMGAKQAFSPDFENSVIQRQRKELQLLVGELRERDRELNDMVSAHQRQMAGWESDRRRCVQLEDKSRKLEGEIQERQAQIKALFQKLSEAEHIQEERTIQVAQYQERISKMMAENASTKGIVEEVEEANEVMEERLKELSSTIGLLEAREQELLSDLKGKESELMQLHQELGDVSARWKNAESQYRSSEQTVSSLRNQVNELNAYITETKRDCETLRGNVGKLTEEGADLSTQKDRLERELLQVQKDSELAAERERRKDEVIQSQRLKQERSDAELAHLRHLYERMQKDLATLQLEANSSPLCSEDMLDRRTNGTMPTPSSFQAPVSGLPPRPRSTIRNGSANLSYPSRASSSAARMNGNGDSVDALTRQHLEEYRARFTPIAPALAAHSPSPTANLTRVNSLPDLSPRDFVQVALNASKQTKMARINGAVI